ncbi:MAG: hypothetical protein Q8Q04_01915 [archaeon]|nr:hypothetical protein [archaeon]
MGLFSKKKPETNLSLPELPELPNMESNFPEMDENSSGTINELPSFPSSSMGDRFSRESIKNAISGYSEGDEEPEITRQELIPKPQFNKPSKFTPEKRIPELPKMKPLYKSTEKNMERGIGIQEEDRMPRETGPVFIRIDKFEEALKVFKETKEKISEIEKLLEETKELKEKEERELSTWESEIQGMKSQIERVDRDIFSKI